MKIAILMVLFWLGGAGVAFAQVSASDTARLSRMLRSTESESRREASSQIFGSGISDAGLNAQLAALIVESLPELDKKSAQIDEIAWHAKALGASGDKAYLPLLDQLSGSNIRKLARNAQEAKTILQDAAANGRPYLHYSKVRVITERQAEACEYIKQQTCETSRAAEKCMDSHKDNAVQAGANAIMLLLTSSQSSGLAALPFGGSTTMLANYYRCELQ